MSLTDHYIQSGLITKQSRTITDKGSGLFSLTKWIKKMFIRFKVSFADDCCDTQQSATDLPIRYNKTAGKIQYYEFTTNTWTNLTTF